MDGVRRVLAGLVTVDSPDPDVRRRGETAIVVMLVLGVAAVAAIPLLLPLANPGMSVLGLLLPLPFVLVLVAWCRRGHVDRAALGYGVVLGAMLVLQPLLSGDPSLNLFYASVVATGLLFMVRGRDAPWVFVGLVVVTAVTWWSSTDAAMERVTRTDLVVNALVVTVATGAVTWIGARRLERAHEAERAAVELALRDDLTGLHNRRHSDQVLPALVDDSARQGRPLAAAIVDIDHFKSVNDDLSYAAGDDVLRRVAASVARTCRLDDVVARIGGEEFLVLMPDTDLDGASAVCERIRSTVEGMRWDGVAAGRRITVSIGVAATPGTPVSVDRLVGAADRQLHLAKRSGRNAVMVELVG